MSLLLLIAVASVATDVPSLTSIPLVKGLTTIEAVNESRGDYENSISVDAIDADGSLHLVMSGDVPDPAGGEPGHVKATRTVRAADLKDARGLKIVYSTGGEEEYPGTTTLGVSAAVFSDIRSKGEAAVALDGKLGGLEGMLQGALGIVQKAGAKSKGSPPGLDLSKLEDLADEKPTQLTVFKLAEPGPVPFSVIVNNALVSLPAWHLKGRYGEGEQAEDAHWYVLTTRRIRSR